MALTPPGEWHPRFIVGRRGPGLIDGMLQKRPRLFVRHATAGQEENEHPSWPFLDRPTRPTVHVGGPNGQLHPLQASLQAGRHRSASNAALTQAAYCSRVRPSGTGPASTSMRAASWSSGVQRASASKVRRTSTSVARPVSDAVYAWSSSSLLRAAS